VLPERPEKIVPGDPLPDQIGSQDLAVADQNRGSPLDQVLGFRDVPHDPGDHEVRAEERGRRDEATGEGGIGTGHGVLDGVGEKKEEEKIEGGQLSDLALPREA